RTPCLRRPRDGAVFCASRTILPVLWGHKGRVMPKLSLAFALGFAVLAAAPALAGLTEVEIRTRAVVADGMEFGTVGPYEKIAGRFHFSIDPSDAANGAIRDIAHAPVTRRGLV